MIVAAIWEAYKYGHADGRVDGLWKHLSTLDDLTMIIKMLLFIIFTGGSRNGQLWMDQSGQMVLFVHNLNLNYIYIYNISVRKCF